MAVGRDDAEASAAGGEVAVGIADTKTAGAVTIAERMNLVKVENCMVGKRKEKGDLREMTVKEVEEEM